MVLSRIAQGGINNQSGVHRMYKGHKTKFLCGNIIEVTERVIKYFFDLSQAQI